MFGEIIKITVDDGVIIIIPVGDSTAIKQYRLGLDEETAL